MTGDSKTRFGGRGQVYAKYRPKYPPEILKILQSNANLNESHVIADIGSGTGILSEIFLKNKNQVYGVEPNDDMRKMAEDYLSTYPKFVSVKGSAEETNLKNASIDLISVGQALHWFDLSRCRLEFLRILREEGWTCVVYNERSSSDEVTVEYGKIVQKHANKSIPMNEYVPPTELMGSSYAKFYLPNEQCLDLDGLIGRAVSASYAPNYDEEGFSSLRYDLKELFDRRQEDGRITLRYDTRLFLGKISP